LVLKPELVATGDGIYTAAQKLDPNGDGYNASGYTMVAGTSYAVPMVAGAVALVKQKNGSMSNTQLKSAVVNTATTDVVDATGGPARVTAVGAGKLKADDALNVAATLDPPTLSFGALTSGSLPAKLTLNVTNVSSSSATFNFAVNPRDTSSATVSVSPSSLTLAPGQQSSVTVGIAGSQVSPGAYEGSIAITGAGPALHAPYQYLVGSGVASDIYSLSNGSFVGGPGDTGWLLTFRLIDQFGTPVTNAPITWNVTAGGGTFTFVDPQTDVFGVGAARASLGPNTGPQTFTASAGGLTIEFDGSARNYPDIPANAVVNAATNLAGQGMAPGSYIAIYGTDLSDAIAASNTASLPIALSNVSVSFDGGGLSLPGHVYYVSPGQVNAQIPWEFQGQSSVQMKVTVYGYMNSYIYNVPLTTYSPGIFAVVDFQTGAANTAKRGDTLVIYANGLGPVSTTPASGEPTPAQPLPQTGVQPSVTIGGTAAQVIFSGLTPGSVGLYQVNATIPPNAPTGTQPLVLSIGGLASQTVNLTVQ
jgi:uncharacterized protein (TIGR03437 family)